MDHLFALLSCTLFTMKEVKLKVEQLRWINSVESKEGIDLDKEIGCENHHFQFRENASTYFHFILYWKKYEHRFQNSTKQWFGSISQALTRRLYVTSSPLWTRVACVLVEEQKIHIDNDFSKRLFQVIGRALNYYNEVKERSLEKN